MNIPIGLLSKSFWFFLGAICLLLGIVGIFLPVMPTTPFIILAAACFAKSSPKLYHWLKGSHYFGPIIQNWEDNRCVTCKIKIIASLSTALLGGSSVIFFVPAQYKIYSAAIIGLGLVVILVLPTCKRSLETSDTSAQE